MCLHHISVNVTFSDCFKTKCFYLAMQIKKKITFGSEGKVINDLRQKMQNPPLLFFSLVQLLHSMLCWLHHLISSPQLYTLRLISGTSASLLQLVSTVQQPPTPEDPHHMHFDKHAPQQQP